MSFLHPKAKINFNCLLTVKNGIPVPSMKQAKWLLHSLAIFLPVLPIVDCGTQYKKSFDNLTPLLD